MESADWAKLASLIAEQLDEVSIAIFLGGVVFFALVLAVSKIAKVVQKDNGTDRASHRLNVKRLMLVLFSIWWLCFIASVSLFQRANDLWNNVHFVWQVSLIPFDPSSWLIQGKQITFNLFDFSTFVHGGWIHQRRVLNALLDFVLFVPLGWGLASSLPAKHWIIVSVGACFAYAALIEILQYIFSLGNVFTDEVIFRTAGALVGCVIARLIRKRFACAQGK